MMDLREAEMALNSAHIPIRYHTLYQWARDGILVGEKKKMKFASRVGNRWVVQEGKIKEIIDAVRRGENIRVQRGARHKKNPNETRGRKPGTKFGTYGGRGKDDSNGV